MVKMASKESSPPPPSFLGFAVHQSIKFSEILFSPSNSYSAFAFYKNSATFFNPMKNKHPNLYSKTPNWQNSAKISKHSKQQKNSSNYQIITKIITKAKIKKLQIRNFCINLGISSFLGTLGVNLDRTRFARVKIVVATATRGRLNLPASAH